MAVQACISPVSESVSGLNWQQIEESKLIDGMEMPTRETLAGVRAMKYMPSGHLLISDLSFTDSLVRIVDLDSPQPLRSRYLLKQGQGPCELDFVDHIVGYQDQIRLYDPHRYQVVEMSQKTAVSNDSAHACSVFGTKNLFADFVFETQAGYYATYLFGMETQRFAQLNEFGEVVSYFGDFPASSRGIDLGKEFWNLAYAANVAVAPDGGRFALTYRYQDLVEIYDARGVLLHSLAGPDHFAPAFEPSSSKKNIAVPVKGKTRKAFVAAHATSKAIYMLYSGKVMDPLGAREENLSYLCDLLFQMSWDGEIMRTVRLDPPIYYLALDEENMRLFGASEKEDVGLYSYDLGE